MIAGFAGTYWAGFLAGFFAGGAALCLFALLLSTRAPMTRRDDKVVRERDRYKKALQEIMDDYGHEFAWHVAFDALYPRGPL